MNGAKNRNVCFGGEITGTKSKTLKSVLGSSYSEDGFCNSETRHCRRTVIRPKLFLSAGRLQKQMPPFRKKLSWVQIPVKTVSLARKLSI
jgi:hypothetical protein